MKRAVSVSLGSVTRDKSVEIELFGEKVLIERIGTDGDVEKATRLYNELDGKIDCFGVGGIDLSAGTDQRDYPIYAARKLVRGVTKTPVVDGRGLKFTLERQCMTYVEAQIGDELRPKRAMVNVGSDRYGMAVSLIDAGYDMVFGDLLFALGIPIPIRSLRGVDRLLTVIGPIAGRLPIHMIYPTGEKQLESVPRFVKWYNWATVLAGDCAYTKRHMPPDLSGKTVLTNTTTEADVEKFRKAGVRYLVTTTPRIEGRSFGTNMMESALVAVAGKGRTLTREELTAMIRELGLHPHIEKLNG
ncbi:MAG: quinate 5-dehydrogenase [Anaerolineae bacterium]|nr:quinate 5-dehydrogenase [Anaerolineae bacterium]